MGTPVSGGTGTHLLYSLLERTTVQCSFGPARLFAGGGLQQGARQHPGRHRPGNWAVLGVEGLHPRGGFVVSSGRASSRTRTRPPPSEERGVEVQVGSDLGGREEPVHPEELGQEQHIGG